MNDLKGRIFSCVGSAVLAASLFVLGLTTAQAETAVARTGVFLQGGSTPQCDDIITGLEQVGTYLSDHIQNLGKGLGHLMEGDPEALIDEINAEFKDLGKAAATLSKYSPLALAGVIANALPPGAVTDFLKKGVKLQDSLRAAVGTKMAEGLNPLATGEALVKDFKEAGTDFGKVLNNLDDPASAANEFLKLQQKWSGAGALTYVFTEKDPAAGLQKALRAMHRQVEVATDLGAGPEGKVAEAVLDVVMDQSKNYIDQIKDPQHKRAAGALAATFLASYHSARLDPQIMKSQLSSRHPFYFAEKRLVNVGWEGDDYHSGGTYSWGLIHPVVEDKPGCISLSDYAYPSSLSSFPQMWAICGVEDGRDKWWSRPIDYKRVWGDNCSGAEHNRSIWAPVCKTGFVAVGFAANTSSSAKPLPNAIACLKNDPNLLGVADGVTAGMAFLANDSNTGGKFDVTVYQRQFAGIPLMHAVPYEKASNDSAFVQQARLAVPVAGGPMSDADANCVNFFTETNYRGRTSQACNTDRLWTLDGDNLQVKNDVSSFRCGDAIAAVRLYWGNGREFHDFACDDGAQLLGIDNRANSAKLLSSYYDTARQMEVLAPQAYREIARKKAAHEAMLARHHLLDDARVKQCRQEGDDHACYMLARDHAVGTATLPQNMPLAVELYWLACDAGNRLACPEVAKLTKHRCENAIGRDCTRYGELLERGLGVEQDLVAASNYYDKGCGQHDGNGCLQYGDMLRKEDSDLSRNIALISYAKGCEYGKDYACVRAGNYLRDGSLGEQDSEVANRYFREGCRMGVQESCDALLQ